jgi:hypothetical protein
MTPTRIDCAGAPRDLGFDQGRQLRDSLAGAHGRQLPWRRAALWLGLGDVASRRLVRDLARHFPQQSEFLEGMVRGAGVSYRWLAERTAQTFDGPGAAFGADSRAALLSPPLAQSMLLARTLPGEFVVRHSLPDGGWPSVEFTLPWLSVGLAGVNAGGLAAAVVPFAGSGPTGPCAAPAALLAQDCLARFDSVAGARDWCLGRPAGGRAAVLLCDASGAAAAVEIDGRERGCVAPEDGLLLGGGDGEDLAGRLGGAVAGGASALAAALGDRVAVMDPVGRRIGLFEKGGHPQWWRPADPEPEAP